MENTFWDSFEVIDIIKKSETSAYQITKAKKGNNVFIDIRKMYKRKDEDVWKFTKKGVSLPIEIKDELIKTLINLEI
ncbi:PC4/YdbC family ssDNA-binding protein [Kyrpidia sp.]|uniref:PC4/YdbC family ssDNA-binding protein n=1 Tax=Kyrpidia sp. TaxID=2073077 RepID=UPI00258DDE8A|nr:PC4/YdbC family ssDNA-binding protein [Kyrpidia sp.]MCL6575554.1 transcriptional coactivator p15/PC4 family protein [Kyrpidia sp.]